MKYPKITPGQDPDEFLHIMNSYRDLVNTSTPPESPADRQYGNILLQVSSQYFESIRRAHLERRDYGLADIRGMTEAIYADNHSRRSIISAGIAAPGTAVRAIDRALSDVQYQNYSRFNYYRRNFLNRRK